MKASLQQIGQGTRWHLLTLIGVAVLMAGCSSNVIKSTEYVPVVQETAEIPESELLDVGIHIFDPNLENPVDDDERMLFPEVRKAESRFIPYQLMASLQKSSAWGAVRVIPNQQSSVDVNVEGKILQSDGEQLLLFVTVRDATGNVWFEKEYEALASKYAYTADRGYNAPDPFQGLYNRIANDMLAYRRQQPSSELLRIRTVAELKFAQNFSPTAFGEHLKQSDQGTYSIQRLPADNDPMMERIRLIRERDYLFVDTLQDYYGTFVKEMQGSYQEWRKMSYDEVIALRELKRDARNRTIAGIAAIIAGVAAAGGDNGSSRAAGSVAVAAGGYLIKSGFDKRAESQMHIEALMELGDSLEADIEPQVIELEDRTITLSGSVENQYEQWRELLQEIYRIDTGIN
jgi:hypothetical protein